MIEEAALRGDECTCGWSAVNSNEAQEAEHEIYRSTCIY